MAKMLMLVLAACALHNKLQNKDIEHQPGSFSLLGAEEGGEMAGLTDIRDPGPTRNHTRHVTHMRDGFVTFFNGVGSVSGQQAHDDRARNC